jgi:hypothetical protein
MRMKLFNRSLFEVMNGNIDSVDPANFAKHFAKQKNEHKFLHELRSAKNFTRHKKKLFEFVVKMDCDKVSSGLLEDIITGSRPYGYRKPRHKIPGKKFAKAYTCADFDLLISVFKNANKTIPFEYSDVMCHFNPSLRNSKFHRGMTMMRTLLSHKPINFGSAEFKKLGSNKKLSLLLSSEDFTKAHSFIVKHIGHLVKHCFNGFFFFEMLSIPGIYAKVNASNALKTRMINSLISFYHQNDKWYATTCTFLKACTDSKSEFVERLFNYKYGFFTSRDSDKREEIYKIQHLLDNVPIISMNDFIIHADKLNPYTIEQVKAKFPEVASSLIFM